MKDVLGTIGGGIMVGLMLAGLGWYFFTKRGRQMAGDLHSALHDQPGVTCPICHRHGQVQRVTGTARVTSAAAGGLLFSRKARARYYCPTDRHYW